MFLIIAILLSTLVAIVGRYELVSKAVRVRAKVARVRAKALRVRVRVARVRAKVVRDRGLEF